MANFIPPANGASQGNYFLPKSHKSAVFEKQAYKNSSGSQKCKLFLIEKSGFGQIPHERDLAFFPTGTYKLQGLGCRYKMA